MGATSSIFLVVDCVKPIKFLIHLNNFFTIFSFRIKIVDYLLNQFIMQKLSNNKINITLKIISLALPIGFLCSVIYNYGYFYALDFSINEIPLTLVDYTETTLLWSIPAFLLFLSASVIELILRRLEHGMTEEEIIESTNNPEKTRKFRNAPYKFAKWVFILYVISSILGYIIYGSNFQSPSKKWTAAIFFGVSFLVG